MEREHLAQLLNGREYMEEITEDEERQAKEAGLVVLYGYSDDNVELRGAVSDEVGAYDGTTFLITRDGKLWLGDDEEDREVLEKYGVWGIVQANKADAIKIEAKWCATEQASWTFETQVPHSTFDVMEDGELFCRGIVIDLRELAA